MGIYKITYTPELKEVCLYLGGGCNFSCHGCVSDYHHEGCHTVEQKQLKNRALNVEEVMPYLKPLSFEKAIFLGKEPTLDFDFLPLARVLKESFYSYNIFLTNGYRLVEDTAINEVCVSIKAISKELFKDFTGKDNPERVLRNFKRYAKTSVLKVRAESIFIPDFIDIDEIEKIAEFIVEVDFSMPYRIDAYIPFEKDKFRRPTEEEMKRAKTVAEKYLKNVSILHSGVKVKHKVERIY